MNKNQKEVLVSDLHKKFEEYNIFYIVDISGLSVEKINHIRRKSFEQGIKVQVAKNSLIIRALGKLEKDTSPLQEILTGPNSIMFSSTTGNSVAKLIKQLTKTEEKPTFKGAYIDGDIYVGADKLKVLETLKSKEELVADIIALLQSPINNVMSSLQSGQNTISNLLTALKERSE